MIEPSSRPARLHAAIAVITAFVAAVALAVLVAPGVGQATGIQRENLPSTLTAVSIGSPPVYNSVDFFGIAPLEIPDPDADPALSSWGYRYRVVAAGNLPNSSGTLNPRLALWDSNSQVWRPLGFVSGAGSGLNTKFLQLWVNTKCPRMYVASVGAGTFYDSIDSSGKCSDANPTASSPRVNLPQSMSGLPIGASLNAFGGAAFGSEVGNPTVFGGVINVNPGLYKLDNLPSQPLWSLPSPTCSNTSLGIGPFQRIAVGNYDPVNDTYTVIGLDGSNKIVRGQSTAGGSVTCSVVTVDADASVVLNDVAFVGSTATVIAVGNGGRRYVSTRAGVSGFWARVNEPAGQAYTDLGYPGTPPDLTGIEAFAAGPTGRSAVVIGNRPGGSAGTVTPLYRVDDVAKPGALDSPSSDLFDNLAAIGGIDPEHFWVVRNGIILRSFPGSVSGYNWFGPDATSNPNGFFAKLSCGTTATCDLTGQNYGLNIESSSGLQPSALTGRAWVGLADGTAGVLSGGLRPNLQEHTEMMPGVLGRRIGLPEAASANRMDRIAVAGNYLYTGGRLANDASIQRVERRQITASGDTAGKLVPQSTTTTCASGTYDAGDNGYFQFGTPTVAGTDYLQVVSPCNGSGSCTTDRLRVRTVRADDANYCTDLKTPAPASVALVQTPGCIRNASAADFGVADYTNTLYAVGGTCGGVASSTIYRSTVAADGTPADAVANPTGLWQTMTYPKAFVAQSPVGAAMVVYNPTSRQLGVAPINTTLDGRCAGPVGTVCSFTVQTNAVKVGIFNGASAYPTAVGLVGDYLLATYRSTDFNETPGAPDPRVAFRGRTVLASRLRLELPAGSEVTAWFAAADRTPTNFLPPSITGWTSGSRAAGYFGPILDDRGWWSVQRYDTEQFATSPGWLSFNYADNFDYETGSVQAPPSTTCIPFGTAQHRALSRINQNKSSYTVTGCATLLYPDEFWGWGRFLTLKAEGERQSPRETDWGWVSLRGPTVPVPSSATLAADYLCFDCSGTAPSGQCAFCQSKSPKSEALARPTCSQCTGCDPALGTCGAGSGTCAVCYQYGVNLDRSPSGTFHGYAWSGGMSQSASVAARRIYSYTCDGQPETWLQSLLQGDAELNALTTYYSDASCNGYGTNFKNMMTAVTPGSLIVLQDAHLATGNQGVTDLQNFVSNGGTLFATGEIEELNGPVRDAFAGAVICQSYAGDPAGAGCGFCTQDGSCSTSGATVGAGSHYPFDLVAGDTIAKPPEARYEGVILNSAAYGGTIVPAIDAPYTMSGTTVGTVGEIAHWGFGSGQVYYVSDESSANPPTSCAEAECKNSSVALTQAFFANTMRNLAKNQPTGFGWVSFEQGATGSTKFATFVQAQYGSIYSGGKITSTRGASPFAEFGLCNAFLIQSASDTITSLCANVAGKERFGPNPQSVSTNPNFNPGLVTNATPIPFPKAENQYTSTVGQLDVPGLTTVTKTVGGVDYNKYGNVVETLTPAEFVTRFSGAGAVLAGKIYNLIDSATGNNNLTINAPLLFKAGSGTTSGSGLIVVNGTLRFSAAATYESVTVDRISHLASAGWLVASGTSGPPDVTVDASVSDVAGAFYVRGLFRSLTGGGTDVQLFVRGPTLASQFDLQRNAVGTGSAVGSEVFIDDPRFRLNPPPGFRDLRAALPIYR